MEAIFLMVVTHWMLRLKMPREMREIPRDIPGLLVRSKIVKMHLVRCAREFHQCESLTM